MIKLTIGYKTLKYVKFFNSYYDVIRYMLDKYNYELSGEKEGFIEKIDVLFDIQ